MAGVVVEMSEAPGVFVIGSVVAVEFKGVGEVLERLGSMVGVGAMVELAPGTTVESAPTTKVMTLIKQKVARQHSFFK